MYQVKLSKMFYSKAENIMIITTKFMIDTELILLPFQKIKFYSDHQP